MVKSARPRRGAHSRKRGVNGHGARKRAKPVPTIDDCVIPPRLAPEVASKFVMSGEAAHERDQIREYVEWQAHEEVKHVERIKAERVFGREYEVWDVHTNENRWWVITAPTNLYSQADFPSADYTLSLHVGLMARVMARQEPPVDSEERERSAVPWRRWEQAHEALERGDEAEDFQAVGMRCRECLLEMVRGMAHGGMVQPGDESPKAADFVLWTDLIVGHVVPGASGDELRRHLRTVAKSTWQYVNWLTHATNAVRFDARLAVESTSSVLVAFGAAVIRKERGAPDRCPACRSYQIDSVYDPAIESAHPYRAVCSRCGWTDHQPSGTS